MNSRCCLLAQTEKCCEMEACRSFLVILGAYFRAVILLMMEKFKAKWKDMFSSRGCLGCFTKTSHGLKIRRQKIDERRKSESIWSSSPCEMDISIHQSQGSKSSITCPDQKINPNTSTGESSSSHEFVNQGLLLWNQLRQEWNANRNSPTRPQIREPRISVDATYESLLQTNKPFPHPIPLPEMVDFLVEVWEEEGLYD